MQMEVCRSLKKLWRRKWIMKILENCQILRFFFLKLWKRLFLRRNLIRNIPAVTTISNRKKLIEFLWKFRWCEPIDCVLMSFNRFEVSRIRSNYNKKLKIFWNPLKTIVQFQSINKDVVDRHANSLPVSSQILQNFTTSINKSQIRTKSAIILVMNIYA